MAEQNCNVGATDTGQSCTELMYAAKKFVLQQTYNSVGVLNELDLTAGPFDKTFFDALTNHTDESVRWYPLPEVKNVTNERGDPNMETFDDNSKVFIEETVRAYTALMVGSDSSPQMCGKINENRGLGWSLYEIDKAGNLIGKIGSSSTKFCGRELEGDTLYAGFVASTDKTIQKLKLMFDISINEDDKNIRMIKANELSYDLSKLRGLINVTSVITNKSTTGFTAKLLTDGGTPINPVLVKGLAITDFVSSVGGATSRLYNVTDAANVTITSISESPAGVYTFAFAAQTSADVLVLKPLKTGFIFTDVITNTITIP